MTANFRRERYVGMPLETVDFRELKMLFSARVDIRLNDGTRLKSECIDPPGAAYTGTIGAIAREKMQREASRVLPADRVALLAEDIAGWRLAPGELLAKLH